MTIYKFASEETDLYFYISDEPRTLPTVKMSIIQSCGDTKDCVDLFRPQGLYLKPIARVNVSVQLPALKKAGAKISNWEVMEKVKEMARPFTFPVFKVSKSSLEFIR